MTRSTIQAKHGRLTIALAASLALAMIQGGMAQTAVPDGDHSPNLLTRPYLTPTGEVVPKPGQSQSGPETSAERKAQQQNDRILNSICSNC